MMAYDDRTLKAAAANNITLAARKKLEVSGVEDVESFDENTIVLYTTSGLLIVRGSQLHIEKLSIDGGELSVEGTIDSLCYEDAKDTRESFFSRLFK